MVKTYQLSEIDNIAAAAWEEGKTYRTWVFDAPMGAGKTTFIHALCKLLGVTDHVSSPTFALVNEYESPEVGTICHMDWYRLKDDTEAIQAGMEDAILANNYCLIEWPGKAPSILPENRFRINIELVNETTRKITTSAEAMPKKN
ncbi:MAG: tsaE [Chitinophagaceae bacterium]|nr:tsaE [Chitinophagaceae bacterium]